MAYLGLGRAFPLPLALHTLHFWGVQLECSVANCRLSHDASQLAYYYDVYIVIASASLGQMLGPRGTLSIE
jgi:hypothetical protein